MSTGRRGRARPARLGLCLAATALAACASLPRVEERTLRIAGSDTMRPLAVRWADAFMTRHPGTSVQVEAGGSTSGIRALIEGRTALATASRTLFAEEVRALAARHGTVGLSVRCARDGVSIYLHPANPVRDIGLPTLKAIFSGRLGTWRELGGLPDAEVHVVIRPPSSGTHGLVRSLVLHEEPYSERATVVPTTEAVLAAVRGDPAAVGFGGMAFGGDLVHASIDGVAPTPRNVHTGAYPLGRYLYLHAVRPPRGIARRFVDFVLSSEGQRLVEEAGFVPLWDPDELPRAPGRPEPEGSTGGQGRGRHDCDLRRTAQDLDAQPCLESVITRDTMRSVKDAPPRW